ncbi:MAG: bifunctional riboflavin kinase/FAD synthetase [Lachnospiraceae bacterium]|nr:bifunctional riboflavin kinase/FAD synthetase [Lachnospiraceae bacterium]
MKIINHTLDFSIPEESAITLGKFDGIHKGHQKLMHKILDKKASGLKSVVFTFGQMPGTVFDGKGRTILTSKERQMHLEKMGIDYMIECPFVPEIIQMEPEKFIEEILVNQLHVKYIAVGPDFRFGYQRKGGCSLLKKMASVYGYEVEVFEKECLDEKVISSTYVRYMLEIGEMETVKNLLGYPYYVSGTVVHGHAIGRKLGIPTINLIPDDEKKLPPNGVYLTKTLFGGQQRFGITNIGVKPTISGEEAKGIETHLFDFDGDLYDEELVVEFYAYSRGERKFDSLESLKEQLAKDISWGKEMILHNLL